MGSSTLSTAIRYGLISAAIGGALEFAFQLAGLLSPGGAPGGKEIFFGLIFAFSRLIACCPLYLLTHYVDPPVWMLSLNLALCGFIVGAIVGTLRAMKAKRGSEARDSGV